MLAVFAFARLVTAIPLTPGGVGIVELALISGISAAGGERAEVVAAVLIFRLLTYVVPDRVRRRHLHVLAPQPLVARLGAAGARLAHPALAQMG